MNGRRFRRNPNSALPFTGVEVDERTTYTTVFGPRFHNPQAQVYTSNVHNLSTAINRLDGSRESESALTVNNVNISPYAKQRRLARYLESFHCSVKSALEPFLLALGDDIEEQIKNACDKRHTKYKARVAAINKLMDRADVINSLFMEGSDGKCHIKGMLKIPEFAKYGKKGRLLGDFGCPGSLLAAFLVPILKHAFATNHEFDECHIRFLYSTKREEMDSAVSDFFSSTKNYYIYFSDDMIAKIFDRDGIPHYYNLDISSCDSSNSASVFERLQWYFNDYASSNSLIERAIRQCKQPLLLLNPEKSIRERITAISSQPLEYSGTQLTTLLNNIASSSICVSIEYSMKRLKRTDDLTTIIDRSAFAVGYKVTSDHCQSLEKVQFLKHSFSKAPSDYEFTHCSWFNLGPLFRSCGTCFMDLPYSRRKGETLEGAAKMRNWMMLESFKHSGDSFILQHLRKQSAYTRNAIGDYTTLIQNYQREFQHKLMSVNSDLGRPPVPYEALQRRYGFTIDEANTFTSRSLILGQEVNDSLVNRILNVDYAYSLATE